MPVTGNDNKGFDPSKYGAVEVTEQSSSFDPAKYGATEIKKKVGGSNLSVGQNGQLKKSSPTVSQSQSQGNSQPAFFQPNIKQLQQQQISPSESTINVAPKEAIQAQENKENIPVWNKEKADYKEKVLKSTPTAITNAAVKSLKIKGIDPNNAAQLSKEKQHFQDQVDNGNATVGFSKDGTPGLVDNPGFFSSFHDHMMEAINENKDSREYHSMDKADRIKYLNSKLQETPTPYIGVKPTPLGSVGAMGGGMLPTFGLYAAGAATGGVIEAAAPETGGLSNLAMKPVMSFVMNAGSEANKSELNGQLQRYAQIKQKNPNMNDSDAYDEAQKGTDVDRLSGIAQSGLFSETGGVLGKSVTGNILKEMAKSGVDIGAKSALIEGAKDVGHNMEGVTNKSTSEVLGDMGKAFEENAPVGAALHGIMGAITGVSKIPDIIKSSLKYDVVTKMNPEEIQGELNKNVQSGAITPEDANTAEVKLKQFSDAVNKVPASLSDESKASVAGLILKRDNIDAEAKTKDQSPSIQQVYKDQRDAIDNQINEILRTGKPLEHEINEATGQTYEKPTFDNIAAFKVKNLADKISKGKEITDPEDLQTEQNFPNQLEAKLKSISNEEKSSNQGNEKPSTELSDNINRYLSEKNKTETESKVSIPTEETGITNEGTGKVSQPIEEKPITEQSIPNKVQDESKVEGSGEVGEALSVNEEAKLKELYKKNFLKQNMTSQEQSDFIDLKNKKNEFQRKRALDNQLETGTNINGSLVSNDFGDYAGFKKHGLFYRGENYEATIQNRLDNNILTIKKRNPETGEFEIIHQSDHPTEQGAIEEYKKHNKGIEDEINTRFDKKTEQSNKVQEQQPTVNSNGEQPESKFPKPDKPIHEMNSDELDKYADTVKAYNKGLEVEFFGEEGAKKYREAQSISNNYLIHSSDPRYKESNATIDKMEGSLTPEQRDEFYGINAPKGLIYDDSEIRDIARKVRMVEESENADELSTSVKNALSGFDKNNPSNEKLAILNAAKKKAIELNIDPKDLIKKVLEKVGGQYKDLDDAEFMMKDAYENLTKPSESESKKELPNGENKPTIKEEPPIVEDNQKENIQSQNKNNENAIQQPKTGEVLQRQQGENGSTGSERGRVEQGQQGNEPPNESQESENSGEEKDVTSIKNDFTKEKRKELGLDEEIPAAKKEFGKTWQEAKDKIDNGYNVHDLVDELKNKPRPLTDVENAMLLHHQNTKEIQLMNTNKFINDAAEKDDAGSVAEGKVRKARLLDELQDIYDVDKAVGTENARGLSSRKMMVDRKYSLVNMMAEKRASTNDGKPLSEEQTAQIEKLHSKIHETQEAFDNYVKESEAEIKDLQEKILGKKVVDKKSAAAKLREWADKVENFKAKLPEGTQMQGISPVDLNKLVAGAIRVVADGLEKGGEVLDLIKKAIEEIKKTNPDIDETQLTKAINKEVINSGINSNKVERDKSKEFSGLLDRKAIKLKAEAKRATDEFDISLKKEEAQKRSSGQKLQDTFVKWQRAFKLSNPITIGKLMGAAITRGATTPLEDIVGGGISLVAPKFTKGAIGEGGGLNVKMTAKAYAAGFIHGMNDAAQILKKGGHGKSDIDVVFGKGGHLPPEAIDFFGQLHSATKAPIKRAIFERQLQKRFTRSIKAKLDVTDPMVQSEIALGAYKDANRSIFMQDNKVTEGWQKMINYFEHVDKKTGRANSKPVATALQWLVPFVKVPTNIAAEIGTNVYGVPVGVGKLVYHAIEGSLKELSSDERDIILRNLKKGSLGGVALALGYFNPQTFGGFYQDREKRKQGDVKAGSMKVGGVNIPAWLLESPIFQAMQIGATVRRVKDTMVKGEEKGLSEGVWAGALGLADHVPLIDQPMRIGKAFSDPKERQWYLGELAKGSLVPSLIQKSAEWTDSETKRNPSSIIQHVETGIPGLRENVPAHSNKSKGGVHLPKQQKLKLKI